MLNKPLFSIDLLLIGILQTRLPHAASQHFKSPGQSVSNWHSDGISFSVSHLPIASTTLGQVSDLRIGCEWSITEST